MMKEQNGLRVVSVIVVLAVIAAAAYIMARPGSEKPSIGEDSDPRARMMSYIGASEYDVDFLYPDSYTLIEHDVGNQAERPHHTITLVRNEDYARMGTDGEGPTAITIDIFGNAQDALGLERWIRNTSVSNFKLSRDQTLSTSTVAGLDALSYTWDGLYTGESTVVRIDSRIFMFSVTYMNTAAPIRDHYTKLLKGVRFHSPSR
jgi:hypothetical protein